MNNLSITITDRRGAIERSVDVYFDLPSANETPAPDARREIDVTSFASRQPRFVRLDAAGNVTTDASIAHVAVRDNELGLEWPVAYVEGGRMNWAKADASAKALRLFGKDDWRLPTRAELLSLVDDTRCDPAINIELFPGTQSSYHWTSSPWASYPADCAWVVDFNLGYANVYSRDGSACVRAVRSVVPAGQ